MFDRALGLEFVGVVYVASSLGPPEPWISSPEDGGCDPLCEALWGTVWPTPEPEHLTLVVEDRLMADMVPVVDLAPPVAPHRPVVRTVVWRGTAPKVRSVYVPPLCGTLQAGVPP